MPKAAFAKVKKLMFIGGLSLLLCLFSPIILLAANPPPTIGIVTPINSASAVNQQVIFTTTYNDSQGCANIRYAFLLINTSGFTNCCYAYYDQSTNKFYLADNTATNWSSGSPQESKILENSSVSLDCAKSTIIRQGNTLTVQWAVTFKPSFLGRKNVSLYARNYANASSGWVKKGYWQIINYPPTVGIVTPSNGSVNTNQEVIFTTTYNDPDGWENIKEASFLINTSSLTNCFLGYYHQNTNRIYLRNDRNTIGMGSYPATNKILQNSYVSLDCSKTTVSGQGNTLTIQWAVTFKPIFFGSKNLSLYVKDDSNVFQDWQSEGNWTILPELIPPTGSIKINNDNSYTNSTIVTLNLSAQDNPDGSGLSQMQFSNNNANWSSPQSYATTKTWVLASGDGTKTVYVKFKDNAGNWSNSFSDTIILDTTPPQITSFTPLDGSTFSENDRVLISPEVSDNDSSPLEYQFSIDNTIKQAWSSQASYTWTATLGLHTIKVEVKDIGGKNSKTNEVYVFVIPVSSPILPPQ